MMMMAEQGGVRRVDVERVLGVEVDTRGCDAFEGYRLVPDAQVHRLHGARHGESGSMDSVQAGSGVSNSDDRSGAVLVDEFELPVRVQGANMGPATLSRVAMTAISKHNSILWEDSQLFMLQTQRNTLVAIEWETLRSQVVLELDETLESPPAAWFPSVVNTGPYFLCSTPKGTAVLLKREDAGAESMPQWQRIGACDLPLSSKGSGVFAIRSLARMDAQRLRAVVACTEQEGTELIERARITVVDLHLHRGGDGHGVVLGPTVFSTTSNEWPRMAVLPGTAPTKGVSDNRDNEHAPAQAEDNTNNDNDDDDDDDGGVGGGAGNDGDDAAAVLVFDAAPGKHVPARDRGALQTPQQRQQEQSVGRVQASALWDEEEVAAGDDEREVGEVRDLVVVALPTTVLQANGETEPTATTTSTSTSTTTTSSTSVVYALRQRPVLYEDERTQRVFVQDDVHVAAVRVTAAGPDAGGCGGKEGVEEQRAKKTKQGRHADGVVAEQCGSVPAFAYVLASKQQRQFVATSRDHRLSVIVEAGGSVVVYAVEGGMHVPDTNDRSRVRGVVFRSSDGALALLRESTLTLMRFPQQHT